MTLSIVLLAISNVFMTFAWYGHLKNMSNGHAAEVELSVGRIVSFGGGLLYF